MRTFTVWQSDTPSSVGRTFVAKALEDAAKIIRSTRQIAVQIDADTQGVPGTPAISETILRKIDACDAVLADLTLVSSTAQGKTAPNPNVLIEYGYALKAKGQSHVLLVMNTAFGGPEGLPFDLRHPMQFEAPQALSDAVRRERRSRFTEKLVVAINTVIDAPHPRGQKTTRPANEQAEGLKRLQERQTRDGDPAGIGDERFQATGTGRAVVEFGSGSAAPSVLRGTAPVAYVPIDILTSALRDSVSTWNRPFNDENMLKKAGPTADLNAVRLRLRPMSPT